MKKVYLSLIVAINTYSYAQVGINNSSPKSTLDITAALSTGTLNPETKDGIIIPNLDRQRAQAMGNNTTPVTTLSTLIYVNNSTTGTATGSAINIGSPGFYYFDTAALPAPGVWQPIRSTNVDIYGGQLKIPPHQQYTSDFSNHNNTIYDSDNWWVISKVSTYAGTNTPAKMVIVYEFQGSPFNVSGLYPQLTAGNNSGLPDVYNANMISIENNGTNGRTRLTVVVVRSDNFANNWQGTFLLNVLLTRRVN
ncbi:hypothetical protein [Chryseobacterium sp. Leaf394]|uniref:hypothetical protein n=1 Tax=Chryseobacterium sp. Leaf394 TaxID=1736361 RepID=UPI00070097CB|nr:hypothetical protein [Chryseobacterium sp. Leaf394]KQS90247.1 hypothetical protein ASG21_14940 [Chryseobacterium sp. Leaf394]